MASAAALPPLDPLLRRSAKRTRDIFASCPDDGFKDDEKRFGSSLNILSEVLLIRACSARIRLSVKINDEYRDYKELPPALLAQQGMVGPARPKVPQKAITAGRTSHLFFPSQISPHIHSATTDTSLMIASIDSSPAQRQSTLTSSSTLSQALTLHKTTRTIKPTYHAPWKLVRVISGHLGWVRSVAVEPGNQWFATGAGDRVIKVWDLASGELKLSLTGHISTVRGLAVSPRHPYLFSCGEDKVS